MIIKKILFGILGTISFILIGVVSDWKKTGKIGKISSLVLSLVLFIFGLANFYIVIPEEKTKASSWYSASWDYRKTITVESDYVSVTQSFPILVSTTDTDLRDNAKSDGYDIIFVDTDNITLLDFEIEYWDDSTGELQAWVEVDVSASTDKVINIYYGNSSATDISDIEGTWGSNFKMVQHMNETGNNPQVVDSTSNNNDSDQNFSDPNTSGKIDGAMEFNGAFDYIPFGVLTGEITGADQRTISFWFDADTFGTDTDECILTYAQGGTRNGFWIFAEDGAVSVGFNGHRMITPKTALSTGNWYYISVVVPSGATDTGDTLIYINGINQTLSNEAGYSGTMNTLASYVKIGSDESSSNVFDGTLDEVRISNLGHSTNYELTTYNNQNDPGTFAIFGSEETDGAVRRIIMIQ